MSDLVGTPEDRPSRVMAHIGSQMYFQGNIEFCECDKSHTDNNTSSHKIFLP